MRFLTLFSLFLLLSCKTKKSVPGNELPACLKQKIEEFGTLPKKYQPAFIMAYTYQGKKVFFIPERCCDQLAEVVDEQCQVICNPSGGITGMGDGRCTDFLKIAKDSVRVWTRPAD